jgi:hypothetical protein
MSTGVIQLVVPTTAQIAALDGPELDSLLWELEQARRTIEATTADVVGRADRTAHYLADGHRGVKNWSMAVTNCSPGEASRRDRTARLIRMWPAIGEQLRNAEIGVAQVHELARLATNPRCGDKLPQSGGVLVDAAKQLQFADFRIATQRWEQLADADGAHREHEASLQRRNATIVEINGEFELRARLPVVAGSIIRDVLDKFTEAEFHADWDAATAEHGTATKELLARTAAQRRADALLNVFDTAAGAGINGTPIEICLNMVMDEDQFEQYTLEQLTGTPVSIDPAGVMSRRAETIEGVPVDPRLLVALAFVGHVRRIVVDSNGIVINAGRRRRLFDGRLREVLQAMQPRCMWLGCTVRAAIAQIDHLQGHAKGGLTNAANGRIACEHHNIFKHRNDYQPVRDPNGTWHLHRPDGTRMQPPDAA